MCDVDYLHLGLSLPALRGTQGGRPMYVALPSNNVINTFFPTHIEGSANDPGGHVDNRKVDAIACYIEGKSDSFVLGSIAYATDSECHFEEAVPGAQFGVLRLPLNAKLRSLDGHHRREALRTVVEKLNSVGNQHTALLLYVEPRLERRRAMFDDLNRPSPRELVSDHVASHDTEDPFRVAAETLVRTHPFLVGRVDTARRQGKRREQDFDLKAVIDFLKRLTVGPRGRVKHPQRFAALDLQRRGGLVLEALAEAVRTDGDAAALRWPSALKVVGGAVWVLTDASSHHQLPLDQVARALTSCDFSAAGTIWRESGLVEGPLHIGRQRAENILAAVDLMVQQLLAAVLPEASGKPPEARTEATGPTPAADRRAVVGANA